MTPPMPRAPAGLADAGASADEELRLLDTKIMRGSVWTAFGYGGQQLLSFVSVLVLVRLVDPKAFGLVALASPFLVALQYIQESGLGAALVHRRRDVRRAAATVLVFSPLFSLVLYAATFLAAPTVAGWFHTPELSNVLRVLGLIVILRSIGIVPSALIERAMGFRLRAQVDLGSVVAQFTVAVACAFAGLGVWALVLGQLSSQAVSSLLYWRFTPLRPRIRDASLRVLRELGAYGRFVSSSNLLNLVNSSADNMIVGRLLSATQLGYYAVAYRLATMPNSVIGYIVGRVMFSVYSAVQHDLESVKRVYLQNLQRIAIFALPVSVGLIVAARPIVLVLLGARWEPVVAPLRLLAAFTLPKLFFAPAGELFKGLGRPKLNLVFGIAFTVVLLPCLWVFVSAFGLLGAPLALIAGQAAGGFPAFVTSARILGIRMGELLSALAPPAMTAALVGVVLIVCVELTRTASPVLSLALASAFGVAAYAAGTALFARPVVTAMWSSLRASGA